MFGKILTRTEAINLLKLKATSKLTNDQLGRKIVDSGLISENDFGLVIDDKDMPKEEIKKYTTEDCVELLVKNYSKSKNKDWKRGKKTGNAKEGIVRVFENKSTGAIVEVLEKNNKLSLGNTINNNVLTDADYYEDDNGIKLCKKPQGY